MILIINPCKSEGIKLVHKSEDYCIIYNKFNRSSYKIGKKEFEILNSLNGINSIENLSVNNNCTIKYIEHLISEFGKLELLKNTQVNETKSKVRICFKLFEGRKLFNERIIWLKYLYLMILIMPIPILALGLLLSFQNFKCNIVHISEYVNLYSLVVGFFCAFITIIFHELAHALAAEVNGAFVIEYGIMLYFFMPFAYTSICGLQFINKKGRILTYSAGIMVDLLFLGIAMILLPYQIGCMYSITIIYILIQIFSICMNLLIFLKVDGYYILETILDEKGFREHSFKCLFKSQTVESHKKGMYILYSIISVLFLFSVFISITYTIYSFIN